MGIRVYSYLILYVIVATSFLWAKDFPPAYTFRKGREGGKGGRGVVRLLWLFRYSNPPPMGNNPLGGRWNARFPRDGRFMLWERVGFRKKDAQPTLSQNMKKMWIYNGQPDIRLFWIPDTAYPAGYPAILNIWYCEHIQPDSWLFWISDTTCISSRIACYSEYQILHIQPDIWNGRTSGIRPDIWPFSHWYKIKSFTK